MMAILAAMALALAAWTDADRRLWRPYRERLDAELAWCSNSEAAPLPHPGDTPTPPPTGLVKVSVLEGPDREGRYYEHRWALGRDGQVTYHYAHPRGSRGEYRRLSPGRLAAARASLPKLPRADPAATRGGVIQVGWLSGGVWVTHRYERRSPPVGLRELLRALDISPG